jgi:hypothetical protein
MRALDAHTWHVMDAMADDWESIAQIRPHVEGYCGVTTNDRIFDTLRSLHSDGLIEIMEVGAHSNSVFPASDARNTAWFCMTDAGRALRDAQGEAFRDEQI